MNLRTLFVSIISMIISTIISCNGYAILFEESSTKGLISKTNFDERRNFFQFFNVHYIICHFAAKGKWPFVPPVLQVQVDSASRTIFTKNDFFIQKFCRKWFPVEECHRPLEYKIPEPPSVILPTKTSTTINTEVEIITQGPEKVELEEPTTVCTCGKIRKSLATTSIPPGIFFFDRKQIGNASSETILNTIEFLEGFLPLDYRDQSQSPLSSSLSKRRKTKINVQPR